MSGRFSAQDEDDERDQEGETWFAGGERSGVAVQNPNRGGGGGRVDDLVQGLLKKAEREGAARNAGGSSQGTSSSAFGGGGHTLGGGFVGGPSAGGSGSGPTVVRRMIFWRQGFTVDDGSGEGDGELRRYDDPANAAILKLIDAGQAPLSILNVRPDEEVDVQVEKRNDEDWVPPPVKPFSGTGNRLGAPTPASAATSSTTPNASLPAGRSAESINTRFAVDQTLPMTSVQVRLADGTRIVCRMNLTHTVGDLRNFINASRPENLTRAYTIGTTFPNRTLEDDSQTVEAAGVGGAVVVQRWV
ncbi:hypothetical protein HMN09_00847400 [Mycena chlorophos]|uniref:SEP-domain-containing protein n=1 Tax=Mycena chlorophos TaxID=658473 RepID=A0A8H6SU75_MYCCL|nr:hypothetical protein HMN09_00847400 [Mycena chlorophos]